MPCLYRGIGGLELCQSALPKASLVSSDVQRPDMVSRPYSIVTDLQMCKLSTLVRQAVSCSLIRRCMVISFAVTLDDLSFIYLLTWSEELSKDYHKHQLSLGTLVTSTLHYLALSSGQDWRVSKSPDAFILV